jgi:hypothetical protein
VPKPFTVLQIRDATTNWGGGDRATHRADCGNQQMLDKPSSCAYTRECLNMLMAWLFFDKLRNGLLEYWCVGEWAESLWGQFLTLVVATVRRLQTIKRAPRVEARKRSKIKANLTKLNLFLLPASLAQRRRKPLGQTPLVKPDQSESQQIKVDQTKSNRFFSKRFAYYRIFSHILGYPRNL